MDMMTAPHIAISQEVAGGTPRIAGHRITVQHIVIWHECMGMSADEIASDHGLTLADAIAYATALDQEAEVVTGDADLKDLPGVVCIK